MTTILALDTSMEACSAGLWVDGRIFARKETLQRGHSQKILPMIAQILGQAGIVLSEVNAVAFTSGPGSFTGLRIGFGVVQGLAFGANLPVIPVSTLEVMALSAFHKYNLPEDALILPALDARMNEVYWGVYRAGEKNTTVIQPDRISTPEVIPTLVRESIAAGIGSGWSYNLGQGISANLVDVSLEPNAEDLLVLALNRYQAGDIVAVDTVELSYLRENISWKKRQKLRPESPEKT